MTDLALKVMVTDNIKYISFNIVFNYKYVLSFTGSIRKPSWDHILFTAWHNRHIDLKDSTATVKLSGWDNKQEWMDLLHQYKSKIA